MAQDHLDIPSRKDRFLKVLKEVAALPPAHTCLEAYKQISETLNQAEDLIFGRDHWSPPRTFLNGERTERLYPIMPESFHKVPDYSGVTVLLSKKELIFISRFGAIEVQEKISEDSYGEIFPFHERFDKVIWKKFDADKHQVWHLKNK